MSDDKDSTEDKGYFDGDEWKNKKPDDGGAGGEGSGGDGENEIPDDAGAGDDGADGVPEGMEMMANPFLASMAIAHLSGLLELTRQQLLLTTSALNSANTLIAIQNQIIGAQKENIIALESERGFLYMALAFFGVVILVFALLLVYFLM